MERSERRDDKLELPEDAYSETKVNWKGKALKAIGTKIQKKKSGYSKWRDSKAIGKKTQNAKIMVDKMGRRQGDWESPKPFSHHRKNARPVPMVNLTWNHCWDRPLIEVVSTNPFATTNILYVDRTFATLLLSNLHKAWRSSKSKKQEAESSREIFSSNGCQSTVPRREVQSWGTHYYTYFQLSQSKKCRS